MSNDDFGLSSTHIKRDETKKDIIRFFYEPEGLDLPEKIPSFIINLKDKDEFTIESFLKENEEKFKVDMKNLKQIISKETEGFSTISYLQHHVDVPVYGATLTAYIKKDRSTIFGLNNFYDYDIEEFDLEPKISKEKALEIVNQSLQEFFSNFEAKVLHKYIYRHFEHNYNKKEQLQYLGEKYYKFFKKIESEELNDKDQMLVWQVFAVIDDPIITSFEILVNATSGKI
ncbi:MAG: PepSY domain-containing protein, partial [Candidatus Heimdallarchaeota archaeon]|nr:PepSY domain-containing protein [Candidatus Heimdallarchaeota archaeon]